MKAGIIQKLRICEKSEYGFYLCDQEGNKVLMPNKYCNESQKEEDELEVFIYRDSKDRYVAVPEKPYLLPGEFAVLEITDVNKFGAFADWGLEKELLIPFAHQHEKLKQGEKHLIYLMRDEKTDRLIGSSKVNKYFEFENIMLELNQKVDILAYNKTEAGVKVIVNNKYSGLIFNSDLHKQLEAGESTQGFVKNIREDGKIDVVLDPVGYRDSIISHRESLVDKLKSNNGELYLTDKSLPEDINSELGISKKAFKKAVGSLLKDDLIELKENKIKLKK